MAMDVLTPEAATNLKAYRKQKDAAEADRIDSRFFNRNPGRSFHIRPSLPTERTPKVADAPDNSACLMMLDRSAKQVERIYFPANLLDFLPDDDGFLARLWVRFRHCLSNGKDIDISPAEHRQMLIETGNWEG